VFCLDLDISRHILVYLLLNGESSSHFSTKIHKNLCLFETKRITKKEKCTRCVDTNVNGPASGEPKVEGYNLFSDRLQ
jgi:hypothetical protein